MKSLFKAVALITFFSVLTRALGFLFRIYLSRLLGAEALGLYQVSMSVFMVLLTIVSSGLPLVISKMSAGLNAQNKKKEEHAMVTSGVIISLVASVIVCLVVLIFNKVFGLMFTDKRCVLILIMLLPAVVFSSIYSAFRGSLWGHQNFFAVCITELFEQVVRIILCVIIIGHASSVMDMAMSAAGSMTLACVLSAVLVVVLYFCYGGRLKKPKGYTKQLLKSSIPITSVRIASSLIQPVIAIIVPLRLVAAGYTSSQAMSVFGIAMGMTLPFLFIPSALIGSLSMALVPDLSSAVVKQETNHINNRISSAILFTIFISTLFIPLYIGAGENIGRFFYDNVQSGTLLASSAWIMLPLGLTNLTSSILNSLGLEGKSLKNYILGTILMLLSIWFLPKYVGIKAIVYGMGTCMTLASILNIRMIARHTHSGLKVTKPLLIMLGISLPVAAIVSFITNILNNFLPLFFNLAISCSIGALCFLLLCEVFGVINISACIVEAKKKFKLKSHKKKKIKHT